MRWFRLLVGIIISSFKTKISLTEQSRVTFRVWLTDIDASVMNHAPMMSVFETGRLDLMVRSGFMSLTRRKRWFVPSQNIVVQFFRPLKFLQKATVNTKVFYVDDKWIFVQQTISRKGKLVAICLSKNTIKSGRNTVKPIEAAELLGNINLPTEGVEIVKSYEIANNLAHEHLKEWL